VKVTVRYLFYEYFRVLSLSQGFQLEHYNKGREEDLIEEE